MSAFTTHIWAVWSSVIATEQRRFTSQLSVVDRRVFIVSIRFAHSCFAVDTSSDPDGLKENHTAFCPKVSSGHINKKS